MTEIKIFENQKKKIDIGRLIDSRALICANSGAGKSYTARKILEESNEKVMSIVLDIEGEFRTLREKYDFLLIGEDGDIPLSTETAHLLPKKLLELNISAIIDISELKRPGRVKYVKEFLEALMEIKRTSGLWKPCFIFLDEIHTLAGQQEKQDSTFSVIDLATRGRKRGYCLVGCTQRISKLHKDVVAELNNYMIGRTSLDLDMKRSADILGFSTKADMLSLRNLEDGEFYVFGPAITKEIEKEKVAETKTTHPKRGQIAEQKINPPTEKVKKILLKLQDLPKEAKAELKTLNDYKNKVAELTRLLTKKEKIVTKEKIVNVVDNKAIERAKAQGFKDAENQFYLEKGRYKKDIRTLKTFIQQIVVKSSKLLQMEVPETEIKRPVVSEVTPKSNPSVTNQSLIGNGSVTGNLGLQARKIYSFLFQNPRQSFSIKQVAFMTGYRISGSFNNSIYNLTARGLVVKDGQLMKIGDLDSEIATEHIGKFSKELFTRKLNQQARRVFEILWDNPHEVYSKSELAELTGYQMSGSFNNSIYKLNALNFAKKEGSGYKLHPEILELE